jgi:hypothetical protein
MNEKGCSGICQIVGLDDQVKNHAKIELGQSFT